MPIPKNTIYLYELSKGIYTSLNVDEINAGKYNKSVGPIGPPGLTGVIGLPGMDGKDGTSVKNVIYFTSENSWEDIIGFTLDNIAEILGVEDP